MTGIKVLTSHKDVSAFIEKHAGEIRGLYDDIYYKNGGWNGQMDALSLVEKRYKVEIDTIDWKDGEFEKLMEEVLS